MNQLLSSAPRSSTAARNVVGVLGPTNTGKTHLAIERMLAHPSGMIGLPLRLLAREVYTRIAARIGEDNVALITGEEKILPPAPRFRVCTVEAMPAETDVSFLAIDEVQLAGDLERGHVFTDRILNLRGRDETLLLGAATMRGVIEKLVPGVNVVTRPRMSMLTYSGSKKITRLPRRSAIVAFSAAEVYEIAELIRRQRGGAAVVLGSLSPRTRNAQVDLFQSGDVEFLVATDAIGMGLNLDVDHVAFASDRKFDGYQFRRLSAAELAQIAGRAGRHVRDGTFGVTGRLDGFEDELVEAIESHRFNPVKTVQWRNRDLDFASIAALKASLDLPPVGEGLTKAPPAEDVVALDIASRDDEVKRLATSPAKVALLWDVCQIPDYRKIAPANHAEMVTTLFGYLAKDGVIPDDWFAAQVAYADRTDGDIDTLSNRIAHIRTWTFAANRPQWLNDPRHWQERTRGVEDRLSDALHERLTGRFVDRRTSVLMRRLKENAMLEAEITPTGDVHVEGQHVGALQGFRFVPERSGDGPDGKALRAAAQKALAGEFTKRSERVAAAGNGDFALSIDGTLRWQGAAIAKIADTDDALRPRLLLLADDALAGAERDAVQARLDRWLQNHLETLLKPFFDLRAAETLGATARGIAFRLVENLGAIERNEIAEEVRSLDQETRASLRTLGIRFGAHHIYIPALLKPAPSSLLAMLWALKNGGLDQHGLAELSGLAASGRTSVPVDKTIPRALYRIVGYRIAGERAVRIDILERLADLIRPLLAWRPTPEASTPPNGAVAGGGFTVTVAMTSLLGCSGEDFASVLRGLGYRVDRRPAPPKPVETPAAAAETVETLASETLATETAAEAPAEASAPGETAEPSAPTETSEAAVPLETAEADAPAFAAAAPVATEPVADAPAGDAPEGTVAELAAETPAEPAFIEVWRPGRGDRPRHHQRPQGQHRRHDRQQPQAAAPQGEPADGAPAQAAPDGNAPDGTQRQHRDRPPRRFQRPDKSGQRSDERGNQRGDHGGKHGRDRDRRDNRPPQQQAAPKREKRIDPDSPFAALAALKARLEGKEGPEA
jgi:ATP-dependent RNA helicase SUPV3L1/SUV3